MKPEEAQALVDATLERAADMLGDLTAPVYELLYARHPEARAYFQQHDAANRVQLEGTMVEQALYCLMRWNETPGEIEIVLINTLPHHIETLGINAEVFAAMLNAVCDVVSATIPQEAEDERNAWRALEAALLGVIATGASYARPNPTARHEPQ